MSKTFAKILTICGLILVFAATIVGSAICLSTVYGYEVVVDSVITNNDLGIANTTIFVNKNESNTATTKVKVKKGDEVTISFKLNDNYCTNGRIVNSYPDGNALEDVTDNGDGTVTYKTVVNENLHFTVVHDAYNFSTIKLSTNPAGLEGVTLGIYEENSNVINKDGVLYVQAGAEVKLKKPEIAATTLYDFTGWTLNGQPIEGESFNANAKELNVVANFKPYDSYSVTINVEYDVPVSEVAAAGATEATIKVNDNFANLVNHNGNVWYVRKDISGVRFDATPGVGYNVPTWIDSSQTVPNSTSYTFSGKLTEDVTLTVKFSLIRYNITYVEKSATSERVTRTVSEAKFGSALETGSDYYKDGWNKFNGWTNGGKDYKPGDKLTLGAGNYEFTAKYIEQKNTNYKFSVTDSRTTPNTFDYNCLSGFDAQTLPKHKYDSLYKLVGIKLDGVSYRFNENKFEGASDESGINKVLAGKGMGDIVNVNVEGIWEWNIKSLNCTWNVRGGNNDVIPIDKDTMLTTKTVSDIFAEIPGLGEVASITVSASGTGVTSTERTFSLAGDYQTTNLETLLTSVTTAIEKDAEITLNFEIVPVKFEQQKQAKYKFIVKDAQHTEDISNEFVYNVITGFDKDKLPNHVMSFYKLVGIKLDGQTYKFKDNFFVDAEKANTGLNAVLANKGVTGTIDVEVDGVWEWTFASLTINWNIISGGNDTKVIDDNTMLSTIKMEDLIKEFTVGKEITSYTLNISGTGVTGDNRPYNGVAADYKNFTLEAIMATYAKSIQTEAQIVLDISITLAD